MEIEKMGTFPYCALVDFKIPTSDLSKHATNREEKEKTALRPIHRFNTDKSNLHFSFPQKFDLEM